MESIQHYLKALRNRTMSYINQRRGWTTDRRIVVIESDDWGSIRIPSKKVYEILLNAGIPVDKVSYNKYDSLASRDDMELLFDVLYKYKDKNNHPAVITANTVVANPDFKKIKESGFSEYFFEPFTETLKKKYNNSIDTWFDGMKNNIFYPQYHGREHLNIIGWLKKLREGSNEFNIAFNYETFGISTIKRHKELHFMDALVISDKSDFEIHKSLLEEGYNMFKTIFQYNSKSFIAPCYMWHPFHEKILGDLGVRFLQSTFYQNIPYPNSKVKTKYHFIGKANRYDQYYLVRNCFFEPSSNENTDWVTKCLNDIHNSFKYKKPAIISSHRLNYIGSIVPENRDNNLKLLESLLKQIIKNWPNVEFMTTDQLGELIATDNQK